MIFSDEITEGFKTAALYGDVTGSQFKISMKLLRDSKQQLRAVTCPVCRQNSRRTHRQNNAVGEFVRKPSPPLFLLLLPHPNSPQLQTSSPPKTKYPSSQHNKLYFLKFCGHNIRVLIYRWILSIFVILSFKILTFKCQFYCFFSICIFVSTCTCFIVISQTNL